MKNPAESGLGPEDIARQLLSSCLESGDWQEEVLHALLQASLSVDPEAALRASRALFGILVEGLSDLFEPALCSIYARLFCRVIECAHPNSRAADLLARYDRIRTPHSFRRDPAEVRTVFVLSRVSLGADIAVTSVILDGVKQRFPRARIYLVGPLKPWELFAADPRILHMPVPYERRAALRDRLDAGPLLERMLAEHPESIVVDPDSRLTQLGLLPVCPEENYYFFESRSYGGSRSESLSEITSRWVAETFGVYGACAYIAPRPPASDGPRPDVVVSLGVGGNQAKRIAGRFEADLIALLAAHYDTLLIDRGAGGEEAERVDSAVRNCGLDASRCMLWDGSFAGFAAGIVGARLYVGYDSAGQHAAAVSGVPAAIIFKGYASSRAMKRWTPVARGPLVVVDAAQSGAKEILSRLRTLLPPIRSTLIAPESSLTLS